MHHWTKVDSDFCSKGTRCEGWLLLPEGDTKPPVVVMAHGFAAEKSFGIPPFANRFLERGMATYLFDYRNFGGSDGQPRNLVSPLRHLQDWRAALAHVRSLPQVDVGRMALWGSSFSGGHVIVTAARDAGVKAVVSQIPFTDGLAVALSMPPSYIAKATVYGTLDLLRMAAKKNPYCVQVIGQPDTFAVMNTPESFPGYMAIVPEDSGWQNSCPARILLSVLPYRPTMFASKVKCPTLVLMAEQDSLIPASSVAKMASKLPQGELKRLSCGHFAVYSGEMFEKAAAWEEDFLARHLF
jgi:dienelactone hydrolase